jgi:hypothetical protein
MRNRSPNWGAIFCTRYTGGLGVVSFLKIITTILAYVRIFVYLCALNLFIKQNIENYEENLHAHHKRLVRA